MSPGTSALMVGREPERLRYAKEESMATLRAGTSQNTRCLERGGIRKQEGTRGPPNFPNNRKHRRI